LEGQFAKVADAPFRLASLEATDFPAVLIPAATFKELRRQFYQHLQEVVFSGFRERIAAARKDALQDVESLHAASGRDRGRSATRETLAVIMDLPRDWRFPFQQGADCTVLPLSKAAIHQLPSAVPRMRGFEERIIWQLPFIIFDRDVALPGNASPAPQVRISPLRGG